MKLTIAPLCAPGGLSMAAYEAVTGTKALFLQTALHKSAKWILDMKLPYTSMDDIYESAADFDALNGEIAERLVSSTVDCVYAVTGRAASDAMLLAIRNASKGRCVETVQLPSPGYAECALCAMSERPPVDSHHICTGCSLPRRIDVNSTLCIEEIDTPLRAGELKLALMEYYPDEHIASLCSMDDDGRYEELRIPLAELERQAPKRYHASTVLIVPPAPFAALTRYGADELIDVMERLRAPGGCPWDAEQTHETLKRNLIEEAYEVIDAINTEDEFALCEELGDLLLQIAFHTTLESEKSAFTFRDVTTGIVSKLIYRHPHVFADVNVADSEEVLYNWDKLKRKEKHHETYGDAIRAIPRSFPALTRSAKVQKKAAHAGFDWDNASQAAPKLREEACELIAAIQSGRLSDMTDELGDMLFSCVNVARLLNIDPELALGRSADKFAQRFIAMEELILREGGSFEGMTLEEMDAYWERVKQNLQKSQNS